MIDLHCHILPGVDDGARDEEESLAMARHAVDDGIRTIVATPHGLGGTFINPPEKVERDVAALRKRFEEAGIDLTLSAGTEVHLCPDLAARIMAGEAAFLCSNRQYILVEFPFHTMAPGFKEALFDLVVGGITPVIAHPERNPAVVYQPEIMSDLITAGCLIQVNSTSVTGGFGDDIMACAHGLIKRGLVHIIASDAHSTHGRPPVLAAAVDIAAKILKNKEAAMKMVTDVPEAIISGKMVDIK